MLSCDLLLMALGWTHTHAYTRTPTFADERISRNQCRPVSTWFKNMFIKRLLLCLSFKSEEMAFLNEAPQLQMCAWHMHTKLLYALLYNKLEVNNNLKKK